MDVSVNQISGISVSPTNIKKGSNIYFKGQIGDEFVRDIQQNKNDVNTNGIIDKVKGLFGFDKEKVKDVFESFITAIKNLSKENNELKNKLQYSVNSNNKTIEELNETKRELAGMQNQISSANYEKSLAQQEAQDARLEADKAKEEALKARQEAQEAKLEAEEARKIAAKYEPMTRIKSVSEADIVTPQKFVDTILELDENNQNALDGMFKFLTTGEGQETVLKQLENHRIIRKALQDTNYPIDSTFLNNVEEIYPKIWETNLREYANDYENDDMQVLLSLLKETIDNNKSNTYLHNDVAKEIIKDNAVALISPFTDESVDEKQLKNLVTKYVNQVN